MALRASAWARLLSKAAQPAASHAGAAEERRQAKARAPRRASPTALIPASSRAAVQWLWWPCVTLGPACWADHEPALALSIRGDGRSSSFPSGFLAPCCSFPSRSTWPSVETIISAASWVQHVDEVLGPGSKRNPAGLRWLRAAAESGQSGWPEVPPPVGTRKKLTLTSGSFRAQIDGFDADPRYPGD